MSSFAITDLPQGSIDGCAPTEAGWLARQGRRLLVLAGLIAGCWLLASIVNGAQATAAPVPVPETSAAKVVATDAAATIAHATAPVQTIVAAVPTTIHALVASVPITIHTVVVAVPTTIKTLSVTVHATVAKLVTTTQQVSTIGPVIIARVVHTAAPQSGLTAGSAPTAGTSAPAPRVGVLTRVVPRSTTPGSGFVTAAHPVAAQASTTTSTAIHSAARPAGPQRPTQVPSPAQPGAAGSAAAGQTVGGPATSSLTAAFAPTSFMVSAPSSHIAALLRSTRERPSVSPD
ncbi:MAG: hypothetical protein QOI69_17 [Pseudonocardiales bacterium]|nr:hypothetical protein [Pseudonocardiales bacterium]